MSQDAILAISGGISQIWRLFTSWVIPGTDITPATWAMFSLFFVLFIRFIVRILGDGTLDTSSDTKPNKRN